MAVRAVVMAFMVDRMLGLVVDEMGGSIHDAADRNLFQGFLTYPQIAKRERQLQNQNIQNSRFTFE